MLDRLMMGSPLRRPRVARRVVAGLALALSISLLVLFLVVRSFSAQAVHIFCRALALAAILSTMPISILTYLDVAAASSLSANGRRSAGHSSQFVKNMNSLL
jgi:hypothetical protein